MKNQNVFGFLRIDVHASGNDHEVLTIGEVQVTVRVEIADVTERRPTLGVARVPGFRSILEILELSAAAEINRAGLPRTQLVALVVADMYLATQRSPNRSSVRQPLLGIELHEAVAFGTGVVLIDDRSPPIDHLRLDGYGTGSSRMYGALER